MNRQSDETGPRVILVQDGARGHYGLAQALQQSGMLHLMYTDFFLRKRSAWHLLAPILERTGPEGVRRMMNRRCPQLEDRRVRTNLAMRLRQERRRRTFHDAASYYLWQSRDIADWVARELSPRANVLMGFIRNLHPWLCQVARDRGMRTVADQMIAPAAVELQQLHLEHSRFPEWEDIHTEELEKMVAFEEDTWKVLDCVTCPSDYVAQGLRKCGVSAERIRVVGYPIDESHFKFTDRSGRKGPLTVGFVGQVGLRKGAPYFMQVAKRFVGRARFVMLGTSSLRSSALQELQNVADVRAVVRLDVPAYLQNFDLIYFPTTCEGSAYALMEAMAAGLPIVTSPNSGTVLRHGREGFICDYENIDAASEYIERLLKDEDLRLEMGRAASARYAEFNISACAKMFSQIVAEVLRFPAEN